VDLGEWELGITVPQRCLARPAQGVQLREDARNRVLDLTVCALFDPVVFSPDTPDRDFPPHRPTADFLFKRFAGALAQQAQRIFRHRSFHPQQYTILELAGIIDAVIIQEHGLGERTEVKHMMPVPAVTRQA